MAKADCEIPSGFKNSSSSISPGVSAEALSASGGASADAEGVHV
jgi:hypothetical protein